MSLAVRPEVVGSVLAGAVMRGEIPRRLARTSPPPCRIAPEVTHPHHQLAAVGIALGLRRERRGLFGRVEAAAECSVCRACRVVVDAIDEEVGRQRQHQVPIGVALVEHRPGRPCAVADHSDVGEASPPAFSTTPTVLSAFWWAANRSGGSLASPARVNIARIWP